MKAKEFDEIFEKSDISEFLAIEKSMDLDEFPDYLKKTELSIPEKMKLKLIRKSKEIGLSLEDTIKAILAKELKFI